MINWFTWITLSIVFFFTCMTVYHYASKATPAYVYFFVFVGYLLSFSLLVLLPYDIYLALDSEGKELDQKAIYTTWRLVYWTVFALCWLVLPVIQEYEMSGEFKPYARLKTAVYRHFRFFVIMMSLGSLAVVYLFIEGKLTFRTLPAFLVVLSNCWGLFIIIVLLGYGLVAIPRAFWDQADLELTLRHKQVQVVALEEGVIDTKFELDEIVKLVHAASYNISNTSELHSVLEEILLKCPMEMIERQKAMARHNSRETLNELGEVTMSRLVSLHKDLKKTLSEYHRSKCRLEQHLEEIFTLEDIVNSLNNSEERIVYSSQSRNSKLTFLVQRLEWYWFTYIRSKVCKACAVVFTVLSVLVVLGEVTLFMSAPIGLFPLLFKESHGAVGTQLLCFFPLLYILLCTNFGLFNLKLSGWYGLYRHNQTDPSNLAWSAYYLARLTAPLSYNFLHFIKVEDTQFYKVMGVIDVIPVVGNEFALFFPLLLVVFCALNYFHVYGKVMKSLGLTQFSFSDKFDQEKVKEAKAIIDRERTNRETTLNHNRGNKRKIELIDSRNMPLQNSFNI